MKPAGEARHPGITKRSAVAEREFAKSSGGVGPSWSRANGSAVAVGDGKSAGKARPPEFDKHSTTTESSRNVRW